jgi:hypothetical protein
METDTIETLKEKTDRILNEAFSYAFESNPARTEWPLHKIDCDFKITQKDDIKEDVYYACEVYLEPINKQLYDDLIWVVEGLPCFIDTYQSGRCSLSALLDTYTPENLEKNLDVAEKIVIQVRNVRNKFIEKQKFI